MSLEIIGLLLVAIFLVLGGVLVALVTLPRRTVGMLPQAYASEIRRLARLQARAEADQLEAAVAARVARSLFGLTAYEEQKRGQIEANLGGTERVLGKVMAILGVFGKLADRMGIDVLERRTIAAPIPTAPPPASTPTVSEEDVRPSDGGTTVYRRQDVPLGDTLISRSEEPSSRPGILPQLGSGLIHRVHAHPGAGR